MGEEELEEEIMGVVMLMEALEVGRGVVAAQGGLRWILSTC